MSDYRSDNRSDTCADYACEGGDESGHSHVGVRPYLRRVMFNGKLIDGKTGVAPVPDVASEASEPDE